MRYVLPLLVIALTACATPDVRNFAVVEPGSLVRSGQTSAVGLAHLRDAYGVKTVINLNPSTQDEELIAAMALGLDYVPLPTKTYLIERDHLVTVLAVIRQAERAGRAPVLVHCRSGQDRTGTAVAVFRIVEQGVPAEDALAELRRYQHWSHRVLFPHLGGVAAEADDFPALWAEAVERTGTVPVIRPPAPWPYPGAPQSGVPATSDIEITTEPDIL